MIPSLLVAVSMAILGPLATVWENGPIVDKLIRVNHENPLETAMEICNFYFNNDPISWVGGEFSDCINLKINQSLWTSPHQVEIESRGPDYSHARSTVYTVDGIIFEGNIDIGWVPPLVIPEEIPQTPKNIKIAQ